MPPSLFDVICSTSKEIKNNRSPTDVMLVIMGEVGEVSEEVAIKYGNSYKTEGEDGVIGESIDTIIGLIDLILLDNPNITEEELSVIAAKKLQKWKSKVLTHQNKG
jgi:NTP pyrophosphatase (non-canonical NTP hydrolase)